MIGDIPKIVYLSLLLSGCCTQPTLGELPLPQRPVLVDWTQAEWDRVPVDLQDKIVLNDEALKRYARSLEETVKAHNEAIQ